MPDLSPSRLTVSTAYSSEEGVAAGHCGQFTPMRLPVNTVIHTTLVGLEPATFRLLVDCWSDALSVVPPVVLVPDYKSPSTALLDMHHLTCGISFLLHSVNSFCSLSSWFTSFCTHHLITVTTFAPTIYNFFGLLLQTYLPHRSFPP